MHITQRDQILRKPDDYMTVHQCLTKQKCQDMSAAHAELSGPHSKRMNKRCSILYILLSGKLDVELEEATHHLKEGEMYLVRPGQWYTLNGQNAKMYIVHTPAYDPDYELTED